ncbi:hypothetical protein K470DRAFT_273083 [Piedraia hortae CBS 480.64]|uniref:Uncharacterized protein n=1 Tax=Piedraia hortae CBS 480.64 TaxID=1314780 RepID=A0A6A7BR56_9PEZI|nr:hypothetical protein K470DRAFT_273083 [Piedraia hortae CBS 480.64]
MTLPNGSAAVNVLDSDDYDPIDHLNTLFSHPSALSAAPAVSAALRQHQNDLDRSIASLVSIQTSSDSDSVRRIQDANQELDQLFKQIEGVRERAAETEKQIADMTADIKRLDSTKKNLRLSMTALKRLQMLTTAYEQLSGLSKRREYKECANLLQVVIQLMAHFKSYRSIDQIATLSKNVTDLQRELLEQVCEDFETTFSSGQVQQKRAMLAEACCVVDALGDHARSRLITWYCNTQLREYRQVFRSSEEAGSLDNISRRYSWFMRLLKKYNSEHSHLFPPAWRVNEMLANSFCAGTREDYKDILQKSMGRTDGPPPDVNLLLSCLQQTLDFEHSLEKQLAASNSRASIDTATSAEGRTRAFGQVISEAFEPYLSIWVQSQDRHLATFIPKYQQQPIQSPDEEFYPQLVMPSSTELFHYYRVTLAQGAKVSTGSRLVELSRVFGKYLDGYSQQVLLQRLGSNLSVQDIIVILNTADYCYTTTNQLEERIQSRIDEDVRDKVDLQSQADAFMGVASATIRALVHKVEVESESAWREMRNVAWSRMESVEDQSGYVSVLLQTLRERSREILKCLHKPQYARAYCDQLVESVANTYVINIAASKPISETGAEQMLLDFYSIKKALLELPSTAPDTPNIANAAYAKRVNASTAKIDPILKTLQVRSSPPEGLVQMYLIHIRDRSESNFRKILDLKGITKRSETSLLMDTFKAQSKAAEGLQISNPLIASLQLTLQSQHQPLGRDAGLTPRFDPAVFGSALINAARDAGDRLGTPSLVSPGLGNIRATSPPIANQAAAGLNENLKNLGKFFKRDVGFGGFRDKG